MNTVHSVFGATPPAGTYGLYNDGMPITLGCCFYVPNGVEGASCIGGRIWLPGAENSSTVTIEARLGVTKTANNLDTPALRQVTTAITAGPYWVEVTWPGFSVAAGEYVLISYQFTDSKNDYIFSPPTTNDYIYALDGAPLVLAEDSIGNRTRSYFRYDLQSPQGTGSFYGTDILMDIPRTGKVKVWNGTAWQAHPLKVWDGTAWVAKKVSGHDGNDMVESK